jgi:hypothetical protein
MQVDMVYILFGVLAKMYHVGISMEEVTVKDKNCLLDRQCSSYLQHLHNIPRDNSLVLCLSLNTFDQRYKVWD